LRTTNRQPISLSAYPAAETADNLQKQKNGLFTDETKGAALRAPLLRVVRLGAGDNAGEVILDLTGKKSGRGAYVCPTTACIGLALKQKKLERSLKTPMTEAVSEALLAAAQEASIASVEDNGG